MIGMGAFMNKLDATKKIQVQGFYAKAFSDIFGEHAADKNMYLHVHIIEKRPVCHFINELGPALRHGHIVLKVGRIDGNLFSTNDVMFPGNDTYPISASHKHPDGTSTDLPLILLNAWDDKSFIGNGLLYDRSVDGFYVSGNPMVNRDFRNASFLMNAACNPSTGNPENWIDNDVVLPSISRLSWNPIPLPPPRVH